jgi:hypothetical protein
MRLTHAGLWLLSAFLAVGACDCGQVDVDDIEIIGDGFAGVTPVDARTVRVRFVDPVDEGSVAGAFSITDFTTVPPQVFSLVARRTAEREVTLSSETSFIAGVRYTIVVDGVRTVAGRVLDGTINFTAVAGGFGDTAPVRVVIRDVETARRHTDLGLLVTVGEDGFFSERLEARPVVEEGGVFAATFDAVIDPARTIDPSDDTDVVVDRRPYALLLVDGMPVGWPRRSCPSWCRTRRPSNSRSTSCRRWRSSTSPSPTCCRSRRWTRIPATASSRSASSSTTERVGNSRRRSSS